MQWFMRRRKRLLQIFARTGTWIDQSAVAQLAPSVQIKAAAFALRVRPKTASTHAALKIKAFVPIQTQPAQVFIHGADELRLASLIVEVFIAEDEFAVCGAGALPC